MLNNEVSEKSTFNIQNSLFDIILVRGRGNQPTPVRKIAFLAKARKYYYYPPHKWDGNE
jgi:hypothetical protein